MHVTELDVHCIVDNYATHSHPKVKAWLTSRPRWHMHFIPTYSSLGCYQHLPTTAALHS